MSPTSELKRFSLISNSSTHKSPSSVTQPAIPAEEEWVFRECFAWFDKDGDGYISAIDLPTAVRAVGQYWTFSELKALTQEFPPSTKLPFRQFLDICGRKYGVVPDTRAVERAFEVFDRTGTGRVLLEDVRHVVSTVGEKLTPAEFEELCEINGISYKGGSQTINKNDFLTMFGVGQRKLSTQ